MQVRLACLLLFAASALSAADPDPAALQQAIEEAAAKYSQAFAAQDAQAIGKLFTPEAEYVDADGIVFHGRDAIVAESEAGFALRLPGTVEIEITSIRPVAAGVVVEEGVSTFRAKESDASSQTRYSAIHVRQPDGSWLLAGVRELSPPALTPHDRLLALAWLVGRWRQETDGSIVNTEWTWSDDGNFLISEFTSKQPDGEALAGTHRIGWDGERKQFRSWVFSATGGAADGWWTPGEDGSWSVDLNGTGPEGQRLSLTVHYMRDGNDAIVVSQDRRMLAGSRLPGFSNRVVRQPPAPGTAQAGR